MEMIVSISIFSIITVLMTSIVLSISKFALDNERRNDFIAELDNAANIIKNDLRSAQEVTRCSGRILRKISAGGLGVEYYQLTTEPGIHRLVWLQKTETCSDIASPAIAKKQYLTSGNTMKIDASNANAILVSQVNDSKTSAQTINSLIYITITACSSDAIPVTSRIFNCEAGENPYKYVFGITSRNANL